jgi:hypothetical protein
LADTEKVLPRWLERQAKGEHSGNAKPTTDNEKSGKQVVDWLSVAGCPYWIGWCRLDGEDCTSTA